MDLEAFQHLISFDGKENLYPEGFNGLYYPLDKGQVPLRDCSSAKLLGP